MSAILSYSHEGVTISVNFDRYTFGDRASWHYTVGETNGTTFHEGTDLETAEYDMPGALVSLHSFLSAWAQDGESADLFPADMADLLDWRAWCEYAHSDLHPGEWLS